MASDFPIVDRNRKVSRASSTLLQAACPANWQLTDLSGDSDFGVDFFVQLAVDDGIKHAFFIQLKGGESLDLVNEGEMITYPLKRSTLNYYANLQEDVMLVVAEVTLDDLGKIIFQESKIYWEWMSNSLQARRGSSFELDLSDAKTTNVHVPIRNILHAGLDVEAHLEKRRELVSAGLSLEEIVRKSMPVEIFGNRTGLARLVDIVKRQPDTFSLLLHSEGEFNPDVLPPIANEIRALLRAGNTERAENELDKLCDDGFGSLPSQKAAFFILRGKSLMQRWRREEALVMFKRAYEIESSVENLLPLAETRFLLAVDRSDKKEISDVCISLKDVETAEGLALRVRVHIALNEVDDAEECVSKISIPLQRISRLVLLSFQRKWLEAIVVAEEVESDGNHSLSEITSAQLIVARAAWWAATEGVRSVLEGIEEIPLSGAVGTKLPPARCAWTFVEKSLQGLKKLGWPPNVELIAAVVCGVASMLGHQKEALALLGEAASNRHEYKELQLNLEILAISARKPDIALVANLRQQADLDVLIRRVNLYFELRQYQNCFDAALDVASHQEIENLRLPMALALGVAAAHRIGRYVDASKLRVVLETKKEWGEYLYLSDFAKASGIKANIEDDRPLNILREGLAKYPDSWLLTANLFSNLDVSVDTSALEVVNLSKRLRERALLSLHEIKHLVAAHSTLKSWDDAAMVACEGLERFENNQQLLAMGAVAQEMLGRTARALSMLERALDAGVDRIPVIHNYMGLSLRLGRVDAVRSAIDRLLALVSDRAERIEILRLSVLTYVQEQRFNDAYASIEVLGELVDPSDEQEEGIFLNLVMAATLPGPPMDESFRAIFWKRVEVFCSNWPESLLFRQLKMPDEGFSQVEEIEKILDPITGGLRARIKDFENREERVKQGKFPVPFIIRPGYIFHYIGNPFQLWNAMGNSRSHEKQFHISLLSTTEEEKSPDPTRDVPLLDLTALLVLDELNLFDKIFSIFKRIAVSKLTVGFISQNANGVLASGASMERAKSLLNRINLWLDYIDQPGAQIFVRGAIENKDVLREYIELSSRLEWLIYCDDAMCRALISDESAKVKFCSTLEILCQLDRFDELTPFEISNFLVTLSELHVGISIDDRYLIASLTDCLPDDFRGSASSRLDEFQKNKLFNVLSRAIWNPEKSAQMLVHHMAHLLHSMLRSPYSEVDSAAAVLGFWFNRVRLLRHMHGMGWKLICYPVVIELIHTSEVSSNRLLGVLFQAVAASVGDERMSVQIEKEVASELGSLTASLLDEIPDLARKVYTKMLDVMPFGTVLGDSYISGYAESSREKNIS